MSIGEKIRKYRLSKKFSQEELAEKSNLSYKFLQYLETDKRTPSIRSLRKIATALGIHAGQLL